MTLAADSATGTVYAGCSSGSAGRNGTATISGTPAKSALGKKYLITLTAKNGVGPTATQRFTLRVK